MEPVTTALAGIALVKKSVDFIKRNIQTCQDIGQIMGHIDNAMNAEQQVIKARDKNYGVNNKRNQSKRFKQT